MRPTVAVGMSGGVDSSVAALLLKRKGYRVIGLFMKNWQDEGDDMCSSAEDFEDVVSVADKLEIPFYSVNFTEAYWKEVFSDFLRGYREGVTPNPDVLCNRHIKFKHFLEKALKLGAGYLATGHYCQTKNGLLYRGKDGNKDQSYFLHAVSSSALKKVLFPLGGLEKSKVRQLAVEADLPVAKKRDSTGLCFVGKRDFRPFLQQFLPAREGPIVDEMGRQVGCHRGAWYYTVGQRKGMGIGGPGEAWFVAAKDCKNNRLTVVQGEDHPALFATGLVAKNSHWVAENTPEFPLICTAKIRYRQVDQNCTVYREKNGCISVHFSEPQRAISPGQSVVFYQGDRCLGGACIDSAIDIKDGSDKMHSLLDN